jgi:hypothetical protein
MSDRLDIHAFRSSAKLPEGDEDQRRMRSMVFEASKDPDAPFERMIDYWFAAISWAVLHDLELPTDDASGKLFVDIGQGPNFIMLETWRIDVLNALYLLSQPAFLVDPFEPSAIDTTAGRLNEHGRPVGGSLVIRNANRYALAGAMPMWEDFIGNNVDTTAIPKQLAAASKFHVLARETTADFRQQFAAFGGSDEATSEG